MFFKGIVRYKLRACDWKLDGGNHAVSWEEIMPLVGESDEFEKRDKSTLKALFGLFRLSGFLRKAKTQQNCNQLIFHKLKVFEWDLDGWNQSSSYGKEIRLNPGKKSFLIECLEIFQTIRMQRWEEKIFLSEYFFANAKCFHEAWIIEIKPELTEKHEFEYRDKSMLIAYFGFYGLSYFLFKDQNNWFLIKFGSTSLNISIEALMNEIRPVVTLQKSELQRQGNSKLINIRTLTLNNEVKLSKVTQFSQFELGIATFKFWWLVTLVSKTANFFESQNLLLVKHYNWLLQFKMWWWMFDILCSGFEC